MLFVSYSRRVRHTVVSAMVDGGVRPPVTGGGRDRVVTDARIAPRLDAHAGCAYVQAPAMLQPALGLIHHGRGSDR